MNVLVAPDTFKGTYSAAEVADHIAAGVRDAGFQAVSLPVADGGEGTLDCLHETLGLTIVTANTRNPWGCPMRGRYGITSDGTALIEVAEASGITTFHDGPRDPVTANTYGTGMLIVDAIRRGASSVVVAAGGSATTDGGSGAIAALRAADVAPKNLVILTDVTTRFTAAAAVFGPQKGADAATVQLLTRRLEDLVGTLPRDPRSVVGGGAAGGLAGGLWSAFDAHIESGADYVLDRSGFDQAVQNADAIVVGEGRLDSQSASGKIVSAILRRAPKVPIHAVVGSVGDYDGDDFATVLVASDAAAMRDAGYEIGSLTGRFALR